MNFGSLLLEYIIAGFQGLIWVILLVLTFVGIDWIEVNSLGDLDLNLISTFAIITLPVIYPLGMILDSLAESIIANKQDAIKSRYFKETKDISIFLTLKLRNEHLIEYLSGLRSTARLSRSSALNFVLIAISFSLFGLIRLDSTFPSTLDQIIFVFGVMLAGILCTAISYFSWKTNIDNYYRRVSLALDYEKDDN